MKLKNLFVLLCFVIFVFFNSTYSQENPEKDSKKSDKNLIKIKTNLAILSADNKLDNSVKLEDLKIFEDGVEQKITYFKKRENVLNVGLVFDTSGSMHKNLDETMSIGKNIVNTLNSTDEAFVVHFVDSDKIEIVQDWTSKKSELDEAIDNLFIEGGQSAVLDALYLAGSKILERERIDSHKRYVLILISDAEDRDSYYNFKQVYELLKDSEMQIFLISYAETAPSEKDKARLLSSLIPLGTGGDTYYLLKKHTPEDLTGVLNRLLIELNSNYTVGYVSTNQMRDGQPRKLSVQVADGSQGEKRSGIIRAGFIVSKK